MRLYVAVTLLALMTPVSAQQPPGSSSQPPAPAGRGVIRGVVNAADTGRPIQRATVRLLGAEGPPVESRSVITDEKGRYEIAGLQAGRYTLSAVKTGYLTLAYGQIRARESGRPVSLTEAMPLDKVDFALPRASVIVARITDQFGDPVRSVVVRPYIQRFMNGRRRLSQAGGGSSTITDDRGETRIFGLTPGDYYLAATPDFQTSWRGEIETLYPGTLDMSQAQIVRVGVGEEVVVTFPILRARLATLSGRIVGSDGGRRPAIWRWRSSISREERSRIRRRTRANGRRSADQDGRFIIRGLPPAEGCRF